MPQIPVNLGDVEAYENLPLGRYLGEIDKIVYKAPREEGKFPQFMATLVVIDGDSLGRKSSEFVSLSPNAAFRLKKWFAMFGYGDVDNLNFDDDTEELTDPDLVGVRVVFEVFEEVDNRDKVTKRTKTRVVSVEDDMSDRNPPEVAALAPTPVAAAPSRATAHVASAAPRRERSLR